MSVGKYLSLEESRKAKKLDRFAKEHPSEGDQERFERLLGKMVEGDTKTPKATKKGK
jgi:hypothetical protein